MIVGGAKLGLRQRTGCCTSVQNTYVALCIHLQTAGVLPVVGMGG